MGKAGRFVCVFIPMFLTLLCLAFQVLVGLGGINSKNSYLSNLYFMSVNASDATGNPNFTDITANSETDSMDETAQGKIIIQNFYAIALWGYCAGSGDNSTASALAFGQKSSQAIDYCTGHSLTFWFNPRTVWGLNGTGSGDIYGEELDNLLTAYSRTASRGIPSLYIVAVLFTVIEILIGMSGLFSRLGSVCTVLTSFLTTGLLVAFSIFTTLTYVSLNAAFNKSLNQYGFYFSLGRTIYIYMFLAVACSLIATICWMFSACCCSGRDKGKDPVYIKGELLEREPYTYERVIDGPQGQQQTVQAVRPGTFEPYARRG